MRFHACPTPTICGVRYHLSPKNCKGVRIQGSGASSSSLPPASMAVDPDRMERDAFRAGGGEIVERFDTDDGTKMEEEWLMNGRRHREGGPAFTTYNADEKPTMKAWYRHGLPHREDGPAIISYDYRGLPLCEEWYQSGFPYRGDGGPTFIEYTRDHNGYARSYSSWITGNRELSRANEPAYIEVDEESGEVIREEWHFGGRLHRIGGPAIKQEGIKDTWWIQGIAYETLDSYMKEAIVHLRERNAEFADMPDEWLIEYLKGQWDDDALPPA